jgi:short-subunit dehydrogenase
MRGCKRGIAYHRALVTGATSGIGAAFARELPAATALLPTGRNGERLAKMRAELERPDRKVDCVQADLARREDRDKLIARAEEFGIDLLINNAGSVPMALWSRTMPTSSALPQRSMWSPPPTSRGGCFPG